MLAILLEQEPWTAGQETAVAVGPKGIRVGGVICYDGNIPEVGFFGAFVCVLVRVYRHAREHLNLIASSSLRTLFCNPNGALFISRYPGWALLANGLSDFHRTRP